ncbi:hypothetical protein SAMN05216474_2502 [Lishizhenia tianjinensis]|uniref:Uncharacterized protein n=1 Tax=Lishizhenia tianjinensis TaxID=477690 RepID=A0A1I7B2Z4_9FLAO|nr:hypothetical protein [Lishizhenia tianjinensis]SFT81557.1 hypothetical protein SAMN05216474_2502 [Lishizhenia tianjinensis]
MKLVSTLLLGLFLSTSLIAQEEKKNITSEDLPGMDSLNNVVVVGQIDFQQDLFALEINLTTLFNQHGIKTKSSLNVVKQGASATSLANDSIQNLLKEQGFDTYMLISVRGYDRKFKPSTNILSLNKNLTSEHLFPLYRDDIVSVTFEITFYKDGEPVENRLIKIGTVGSQESVLKKLNKKMSKLIEKEWKA